MKPQDVIVTENVSSNSSSIPKEGQPVNIKPMPEKRKNDLPILYAVLAGCGCCFFLFLGMILFFVFVLGSAFFSTRETYSIISDMCSEVNNSGNITPFISANSKLDSFTLNTIETQMIGCQNLGNVRSIDAERTNGSQLITTAGKLNYIDGHTSNITFSIVKEGKDWKILDIMIF